MGDFSFFPGSSVGASVGTFNSINCGTGSFDDIKCDSTSVDTIVCSSLTAGRAVINNTTSDPYTNPATVLSVKSNVSDSKIYISDTAVLVGTHIYQSITGIDNICLGGYSWLESDKRE